MTAVASLPSLLPPWDSGKNGGEAAESMSAEEVTRMFMPRKTALRQGSSSSTVSSSPSSSTSNSTSTSKSSVPSQADGETLLTNGDQGGWGPRKKAPRFWPTSKAEAVSALSTARGQPLTTPSSGQSAASTMSSALQHPASTLLSQHGQPPQQNGIRTEHQQAQRGDSTALLVLHPLTGTFEKKQIVVPFFPDVQKIGRQTNQKTIPAANNGYFDSKVLSRQHAEIWADRNGKIWIRDVKSSNGTFVNGVRLSQENKESDPHELREQDTLELGIDIVSEDQKSIVHHKVSAKVEMAGLCNNAPMLDVIHLDPGTGQPILADPTNQQLSQMRGRTGSHGSIGGNGRISAPPGVTGGNGNILGAPRQMNMWMAPITIDQVVKKLTSELKQAKEQSHDLHRTGEFFNTLLNLGPGEERPNSPPRKSSEPVPPNGHLPPTHTNTLQPFSEPPAPPPSQPLPEKPDTAHLMIPDALSQSGLKRTEAEKPTSDTCLATRSEPQNGQIVTLLEALKSAKQEIDSQGDRMKYLENALKRERKAREIAERRAQALAGDRMSNNHQAIDAIGKDAFELPLDSLELIEKDIPNGPVEDNNDHESSRLNSSASMETIKDAGNMNKEPAEDIDTSSPTQTRGRFELLLEEMNQLKITAEAYKRRAEEAEEAQRRFAEMVENIRAKHEPGVHSASVESNDHPPTVTSDGVTSPSSKEVISNSNVSRHGLRTPSKQRDMPNGSASAGSNLQHELEKTLSTVLQQHKAHSDGCGRMTQSAPYVSMVGVVLIGVGLMTWLNGWQPGSGGGGGGGER
ncbi:MAG: hypothetical protein Q9163_002204 [Psora crenata]